MTNFQIGRFALPTVWLSFLSAILIASLIYRVLTRNKVGDWYWNGIILYLIVWKLSYILFNLSLFIDMPLSIIYFNGGTKGHLLGLIILSLYLLFYVGKKHPSIYEELSRTFFLFFTTYEVIILLLEQYEIVAFTQLIILISYLILLKPNKEEKLLPPSIMLVWMLMELLVFSIFNTMFSLTTLTFIWIVLTILILSKKMDKVVRDN